MSGIRKLRQRELEADLDTVVLPLLRILQEDVLPAEKLRLHLQLGGLAQATLVRESRPRQNVYPRVVVQVLQNPWLRGETQLADGTALRLRITDLVRKVEKIKRNPRGKTKTRYAYKQRSLLSVELGFRTDSYTLQTTPLPPPTSGTMAIKSTAKRHWVKMRRRVHFPTRTTARPEALPLETIVDTIASAFRHVTPLRKSA